MTKYLDQDGLTKVVQSIAAKLTAGLNTKVSSIATSNADQLAIDATDPIHPKIALGTNTANKIDTMWTLTNSGTGLATLADADIDQIFTDVFK